MKDLQEDNLFGSIRERLGRYEEAPSEELWGKIASRKKERVWLMFLEPIGVVAVGLILLFSAEEVRIEDVKNNEVKNNEVTKDVVTKDVVTTEDVRTVAKNEDVHMLVPKKKESTQVSLATEKHVVTESQISDLKSEIIQDSIATSPIVTRKDSSTVAEVIPPYKKPKSRFQFFLSITPSLSFQKMIPSANDDLIIEGFENRSPLSMKRFGFGVDAGFQKDINRLFGFYGGVSFYHQQQTLTYNYYNRDAEVTRVGDELTFEINRPRHAKSFDYSMTNVGVRSGLLLTVKGEKLKHKVGVGLMYSYNFKKASYVSYQLFYRNELMINDRWSWYIEPTFIYSFISKEKLNEPFTLKPYRAGITTGVLYRF